MALYIANMSGYYESKIRDRVTITEEGIKEFEEKVKNGDKIDTNSWLGDENNGKIRCRYPGYDSGKQY